MVNMYTFNGRRYDYNILIDDNKCSFYFDGRKQYVIL